MFKKLFTLAVLPLLAISSFLSAASIEYEIHDIDTLQTRSSAAIAINNNGQILGWYNIDGSKDGIHVFIRDRNGNFHEIPKTDLQGRLINWGYLTDNGSVYGIFENNDNYPTLLVWDQQNGIVNLGKLPGKEISAINNAGQVLIKAITENEDGRNVTRPAIWNNGTITKLTGLEGDLGIESDESFGFDMNNNGEVVGQSVAYLVHKNDTYKQIHAVKWVNGQAIDLHQKLPKSNHSSAKAINDLGEVYLEGNYLIREDGSVFHHSKFCNVKTTNKTFIYSLDNHGNSGVFDHYGNSLLDNSTIANKMLYDTDSIWMTVIGIVGVNDNGEIIARGKTIYGEEHAMLLTPINSDEQVDNTKDSDDCDTLPEVNTELNKLVDIVVVELDYNIASGIGCPEKPFKVDAIKHLYFCSGKFYLDQYLEKNIIDLIERAGMVNRGIIVNRGPRRVSAGVVKNLCRDFKVQIQSLKT